MCIYKTIMFKYKHCLICKRFTSIEFQNLLESKVSIKVQKIFIEVSQHYQLKSCGVVLHLF